MAPEQAQGKACSMAARPLSRWPRWPYRCITGRHPFSGRRHPGAALRRRPPDAAPAGRQRRSPADVDRWFALALAKAAGENRFRTAEQLTDALYGGALPVRFDPSCAGVPTCCYVRSRGAVTHPGATRTVTSAPWPISYAPGVDRAHATTLTSAADACGRGGRTHSARSCGWAGFVAAGTALRECSPRRRRRSRSRCSPAWGSRCRQPWIHRELRRRATACDGSTRSRSPRFVCGQLGILLRRELSAARWWSRSACCFLPHRALASAIGVYGSLPARTPVAGRARACRGTIDDPGFYPVRQDCPGRGPDRRAAAAPAGLRHLLLSRAGLTRKSSLRAIE